ncbi:hypothetical protein [Geothrix sp. 21YS21S-2]|uniref:hypothetical protein n=1 Tax=Geothrix sp. 21YS21S-2 TaxID=3068893 RepID=UPI0027B94ED3|nr:hypothetical protein [Geothrix sp. 21YS21S-2]
MAAPLKAPEIRARSKINTYLTKSTHDKLKELAKGHNTTISNIIKELVEVYLNQETEKEK